MAGPRSEVGTENEGGALSVTTEDDRLVVDARPAVLASLLRDAGGEPLVTVQRVDGSGGNTTVAAAVRQVRVVLTDDLSVEATRSADFVAVAAADGRRLVTAFTGEVTVLPAGVDGDRFALMAHEALVVPGGGGHPRVLEVDALSEGDRSLVDGILDAVVGGDAAAADATAARAVAAAETTPPPDPPTVPAPARPKSRPPKQPRTSRSAAKVKEEKVAQQDKLTPARRATGRSTPRSRAAAHSLSSHDAGSHDTGSHTLTHDTGGHDTGGHDTGGHDEHDAGGHDEASYEDTPRDWMFIVGTIVVALVIVALLTLFVFDNDGAGSSDHEALAALVRFLPRGPG